MKPLSEKLKDFRKVKGLTQKEFCEQSEISQTLICKMERTNTYQPKTVERIAQYYPGEGFEQYIEYKNCAACGKKFAPMREKDDTCSHECAVKRMAMIHKSTSIKKQCEGRQLVEGTLAYELFYYRKDHDLTITKMAQITGVAATTLCNVEKYDYFNNCTVFQLIKTIGEQFEKYIIRKVCPVCGAEFIPKDNRQNYCSDECIIEVRAQKHHEFYKARSDETVVKFSSNERYGRKIKGLKKPKSSCADIENQARAAGMSYGQYLATKRMEMVK